MGQIQPVLHSRAIRLIAALALALAILTVLAAPRPAAAASGSCPLAGSGGVFPGGTSLSCPDPNAIQLACEIEPGILSLGATGSLVIAADVPTQVTPGQSFSISNVALGVAIPGALSTSFASLGAVTVSGGITNGGTLDFTNTTPSSLPFGGGGTIPFGPVGVTAGQPVDLIFPPTGSFSVGPVTVNENTVGQDVQLSLDSSQPITISMTGLDSTGATVVGPVDIPCAVPSNTTLATIPIVAATTSSSTSSTGTTTNPGTTTSASTTSFSTSSTQSTTFPGTATSTATTTAPPLTVHFTNWTLSGSLGLAKLKQTIALPSGSTFNGTATVPGTLTGDIAVPPFKATIKVLGLPTTLTTTFKEASPVSGTVVPDPTTSGNLDIKATSKVTIGLTGVGILGLNLPVSCQTSTPVSFPLNASVPALDLTSGATFSGTTTLPSVKCSGVLGSLIGPVLTALMSGPNNAFTLSIAPPATS